MCERKNGREKKEVLHVNRNKYSRTKCGEI